MLAIGVTSFRSHSMCIDSKQQLHTFGKGECGRLGHGAVQDQHTPKMVEALKHNCVFSASAGYYHSAVITSDGLFTFGWDTYGQLGIGALNGIYTVLIPLRGGKVQKS